MNYSGIEKILISLVFDLQNIEEIRNNFVDIFSSPRREVKYPSLMVDLSNVKEIEGYYGFYDLFFIFSIIHNSHRSDALRLFDILLRNFDKFRGTNHPQKLTSYVAEYTGNYDEVLDLETNEIVITSIWRVRAIV